MKSWRGIVALVLSLCLLLPALASAEAARGTIKAVDEKAGTLTFSREGQAGEEVLPVDKAVSLGKVKKGMKARIEVEGGVVKQIKPEPSAAGY